MRQLISLDKARHGLTNQARHGLISGLNISKTRDNSLLAVKDLTKRLLNGRFSSYTLAAEMKRRGVPCGQRTIIRTANGITNPSHEKSKMLIEIYNEHFPETAASREDAA